MAQGGGDFEDVGAGVDGAGSEGVPQGMRVQPGYAGAVAVRPISRCAARGSSAAPVLVANSGPGESPRCSSQSWMATTAGADRHAVRGLAPRCRRRRGAASALRAEVHTSLRAGPVSGRGHRRFT